MIDYRNPVVFLRKLLQTVEGIKKIEEWRIYFAVALLCIVISMALLVHTAAQFDQQAMSLQDPRQHLQLPFEKIEVKANALPKALQEEIKEEAVKAAVAEPIEEVGEWYYSEVHKDWRYRKIK